MPPGSRFEKLVNQAKVRIKEVTATAAAQLQSQGAILIDVREADEFAKEHAAGALHRIHVAHLDRVERLLALTSKDHAGIVALARHVDALAATLADHAALQPAFEARSRARQA